MKPTQVSHKKTARYAGVLFLLWIATGFYDMLYVSSRINLKGNTTNSVQQIISHEFLFRTGIFSGLVTSTIWVLLALTLYRLFKSVNQRLSKLLVAFVLVQIPITFITGAFSITALATMKGEVLTNFNVAQREEIAMLLLKINDHAILTLEFFWGTWLLPLALLIYNSRFLPRFLGAWLMINGLTYVVLCFVSIVMPQYKDAVFTYTLPAMFGELALMLWLLIKGAKE